MSERDDLSATYERYLTSDEVASRWSMDNPGNRLMLEERNRLTEQMLRAAGLGSRPLQVLDLGCGGATALPEGLKVSRRIGIDLLEERLPVARDGGVLDAVACADGSRMPFADSTFDLVVVSTVLSSVADRTIRRRICADARRVLRPGGAVLRYDMRVPNPKNRAVSPVRMRDLPGLFPGLEVRSEKLTLNPLLARRLGDRPRIHHLLELLPGLRSHLLVVALRP